MPLQCVCVSVCVQSFTTPVQACVSECAYHLRSKIGGREDLIFVVNELQEFVSWLEKSGSKFGLTVNADKTKVMATGGYACDYPQVVASTFNKSTVYRILHR